MKQVELCPGYAKCEKLTGAIETAGQQHTGRAIREVCDSCHAMRQVLSVKSSRPVEGIIITADRQRQEMAKRGEL